MNFPVFLHIEYFVNLCRENEFPVDMKVGYKISIFVAF